jgi:hypothetical protein
MRFIVILFLVITNFTLAQEEKTIVNDTVKPHSVRKATIYSAVLPGLGQIYNHRAMPKGKKKAHWKVPLIYAGLGASGYFLVNNQVTQKELKTEYTNRIENGIVSEKWQNYDDQGVLTLYNQYLTWRDLSILAVSGVYLLQLIDAGVEAHFVNFDISEDLSMSIEPTIMANATCGVMLKLKFR